MIIPFIIDPTALAEYSNEHDSTHLGYSERLINSWKNNGVLVMPGSVDSNELQKTISELPVRFKNRWQKALLKQRLKHVGGADASILLSSPIELLSVKAHCELVCVNDKPNEFGMLRTGQHSCSLLTSDVEVVRYPSFDLSNKISRARILSNTPILRGELIDDVWKQRFSVVTAASKHIVIVDRYCLENNKKIGTSGLKYLLTKLASDGQKHSVVIYSAISENSFSDLTSAVQKIANSWGGIQSLRLHLVQDNKFRGIQHDRYIRCDDTVIEIGTGLEIFEGHTVRRNSSMSAHPSPNKDRKIEFQLESHSTVYSIF